MRIVFSLPNLRRAEGVAGVMPGYVAQLVPGTDSRMYLDDKSGETPWPGTLTLVVSDESFLYRSGEEIDKRFFIVRQLNDLKYLGLCFTYRIYLEMSLTFLYELRSR